MNKKIHLLFAFIIGHFTLFAQSKEAKDTDSLPYPIGNHYVFYPSNAVINPFIDRLEILSGSLRNQIFTDCLPLSRYNALQFALESDSSKLSSTDKFWISFLKQDNAEQFIGLRNNTKLGFLKFLYQSQANLYQSYQKDFFVTINPAYGLEITKESATKTQNLYRISRGVEVKGSVGNSIGFYTYVTENVVRFPEYIQNVTELSRTIPGEGFYKTNRSNNTNDYLNARGYVSFAPNKYVNVQFGNDRNFIGNGRRSLLLSDFSKDYLQLKTTTKIWRFQYQNIFTQFTDYDTRSGKSYSKKFGAFHYLSADLGNRFNIGLFEGVIHWNSDGNRNGYDFSYLNPVIFYRSVEHQLGSFDNAMIGLNSSLLLGKSVKLYGQFILDEMKFSELKNNKGWIGNKYGYQLGVKYINIFGLKNIDFQTEYNKVLPFTYASDTPSKSYTHFKSPLAHPLGANFDELFANLRINPIARLDVNLGFYLIRQGKGMDNNNVINKGNDPNISYNYVSRVQPYNHFFLQGNNSKTQWITAKASYMLFHNCFIDINYQQRLLSPETGKSLNNALLTSGIRLNFIPQDYIF